MGFSGSVLRNSATTSLRSSLSSEPPDDASLIADRKSSGITAKLEQNRVSDNVGGVKHFLSVLLRALRRARHFALVEKQLPLPTKARSQSIQVRCRSDPCISSVTTAIMIPTSDSPEKGSGTPNQFLGVLLHTIAISGLSHVRTELLPLLVIPSLAPHPVQANGQLTSHGNFGDLSSSPHHQMDILAAPFRQTAYRDLRCFHQQETHDRTPYLVMCPRRRRFALDFSTAPGGDRPRATCHTETVPFLR